MSLQCNIFFAIFNKFFLQHFSIMIFITLNIVSSSVWTEMVFYIFMHILKSFAKRSDCKILFWVIRVEEIWLKLGAGKYKGIIFLPLTFFKYVLLYPSVRQHFTVCTEQLLTVVLVQCFNRMNISQKVSIAVKKQQISRVTFLMLLILSNHNYSHRSTLEVFWYLLQGVSTKAFGYLKAWKCWQSLQ